MQKYAHLEQDYKNLRDEGSFHMVKAWQGNWSLWATPSRAALSWRPRWRPERPGCAQPVPVPTFSSRL